MIKELSLKDLQGECLNILKDVHHFCVTNSICYSVAYGTLIGTIRHGGFIPWDDDIDLIMPRSDYERFCRSYHSNRYKLSCLENNPHHYLAFARVYDDQNTISEDVIPWCKSDTGVWIDIFPVDYVSDDESEFKSLHKVLKKDWWSTVFARTSLASIRKDNTLLTNLKLVVKKILFLNGLRVPNSLKAFVKKSKSITCCDTSHWSQLACLDGYEWNDDKDFQSTILMKFEDMEVYVMNGYDKVLRDYYGDYMQVPPEDKRKGHSDGLTKFYWKR